MMNLFSTEMRRNPFPIYDQMRKAAPVFRAPPPFEMWMVFDYEGVKRVIGEPEVFSSRAAPDNWFVFFDPPQHTKLRALISRAFTPKSITNLEPHIRQLSRELLDANRGAPRIRSRGRLLGAVANESHRRDDRHPRRIGRASGVGAT